MDTSPLLSTPAPTPATAPGSLAASSPETASARDAPSEPAAALSSDFETFLVMLTAQLENQDPLNPIDSTDYAVQLATFSGVEQQVQTNELLRGMSGGVQGFGALSDLAGWVGMEARVAGQAVLSGTGVDLSFDAPLGLREGDIVIRTASGETVARLPVAAGETSARWDGRNSDGMRMEDGSYRVSLSGRDPGGAPVTGEVSAFVRVAEARIGVEGPELRLSDDRVVTPEAVTALREGA